MAGLGKRLRSARERRGLKQTQVKEKTGINNKTLSGYENEVSEPDNDTLKRLAELYEVSTDWLIGRQERGIIINESMAEYEALPPNEKKIVDDLIRVLAEKRKKVD